MTTVEYLRTPETVLPRELAHGVLRVADAPSASHQRIVGELFLALAPFVRERQLGEVLLAPTDVVLDYDADLIVQPDLLFVATERGEIVSDRVYGAPDLVIEVLSPDSRVGVLEERLGWYGRYGVQECWLANLPRKSIEVLTFSGRRVANRVLCRAGARIRTSVLGDLQLTPLQIFGW